MHHRGGPRNRGKTNALRNVDRLIFVSWKEPWPLQRANRKREGRNCARTNERTNERKEESDRVRVARYHFPTSLSSPTKLLFLRSWLLVRSFLPEPRSIRVHTPFGAPAADQRARQASSGRKLSVPVCRLPSAARLAPLAGCSARGSRFSFTLVLAVEPQPQPRPTSRADERSFRPVWRRPRSRIAFYSPTN